MNMTKSYVLICALVAVICTAGASRADILNGDFESAVDLEGWYGFAMAMPGFGAVDEQDAPAGNDSLHLLARNTFSWDPASGWSLDQFASQAMAYPSDPASPGAVTAPLGTTAIEFDARFNLMTIEDSASPACFVQVAANYNGGTTQQYMSFHISSDWDSYSFDLPGLDASQSIALTLTATSGANIENFPDGGDQAESTEVLSEAWFDNVQFVPEPGTLLLLAVGAAVTLRNRKR